MYNNIYIASTPYISGSTFWKYLNLQVHAEYLNRPLFKYYINNCRFLLSKNYTDTMLATVNTKANSHKQNSLHAKKGNKVCIIKVRRTTNGTEIYAKSPMLEKFFSRNGVDSDNHCSWHGVGYPHHLPQNISSDSIRRTIDSWGDDVLSLYNDLPNLSILRAQGLSKGVKIVMPRLVTTKAQMESYESHAKDIVNRLYTEYVKPDIIRNGELYGIK